MKPKIINHMWKSTTPKQKPSLGTLKDFSKNKVLYDLVKPRSQTSIRFVEDDEDPWFVNVLTYKVKTGEIVDNNYIIAKDIDTWLSHLSSMGYVNVN